MIRAHSEEQFKPLYKGYYRIISFKENQVEILKIDGKQGKKPKMVHISDVKYIMPVDSIIPHLPILNQFGRMTKYNLNPKNVPDLGWKLSTELNTKSKTIQIHEQIPQKDCINIDLTQNNTKILKLKFSLKMGGEVKGAWFKNFNFKNRVINKPVYWPSVSELSVSMSEPPTLVSGGTLLKSLGLFPAVVGWAFSTEGGVALVFTTGSGLCWRFFRSHLGTLALLLLWFLFTLTFSLRGDAVEDSPSSNLISVSFDLIFFSVQNSLLLSSPAKEGCLIICNLLLSFTCSNHGK